MNEPARETSIAVRVLLFPLVAAIWTADKCLSFSLDYAIVVTAWLPFAWVGDFSFGVGWRIAAAIIGMAFVGLWEGCEIPLMWLAYLLPGYRR